MSDQPPITRAQRRRIGRMIIATERLINWHPTGVRWPRTKRDMAALRQRLDS